MRYKVKISVIMPCYNGQDYVKEAIDSIVGQSFQDWELIMVDDASTDKTVDIIKLFKDERIRLYYLDRNIGNYGARNYGMQHAEGKYIAMFDADDISLPDRLRIQYEYMETHTDVGAIGCNYEIIDYIGNIVGKMNRDCTYSEFKIKLLSDNYMLQSTIFVRHHLLTKYGIRYDESFRYASDYHFVFQCSTYFKIYNIKDNLVQYRLNPKSITKTKFLKQQMYASLIRLVVFKYYFNDILQKSDFDIIDSVFNKYNNSKSLIVDSVQDVFDKLLIYNYENCSFPKRRFHNLLYRSAIEYLIRTK